MDVDNMQTSFNKAVKFQKNFILEFYFRIYASVKQEITF